MEIGENGKLKNLFVLQKQFMLFGWPVINLYSIVFENGYPPRACLRILETFGAYCQLMASNK
jgi:hypothetical protein